jgi:hypothetical protein
LHSTPPPNGGAVTVLTSDPEARVSIEEDLDISFLYGGPPPLDLQVSITSPQNLHQHLVRWAVILDGDTAMPYAANAKTNEGSALPGKSHRQLSEIWVQGASQARFIRDGNLDYARTWSGGSVLYGTVTVKGGHALMQIVGPTRGTLLADNGEEYSMYFPTLGITGVDNAAQAKKQLSAYHGKPQRMTYDSSNPFKISSPAATLLLGTSWYYPQSYTLSAQALNNADEDRLINQGQAPKGLTDWKWNGNDSMTVLAAAERPSVVVHDQQLQFWAGALFGLLGGFVLWWIDFIFSLTTGEKRIRWRRR